MDRRSWLSGLLGLPAVLRAAQAPPFALAQPWPADADPSGYWVSEKLDGVRARWDGADLITRGGRHLRPPAGFTRDWPGLVLDGELWAGRGAFQAVTATVLDRRPDPVAWAGVTYCVFDAPLAAGGFGERRRLLQSVFTSLQPPRLRLLEQHRVADAAALRRRLAAVIEAGGEGLILQRDDAPWLRGRHSGYYKLKPRSDAEAVVVAYRPGRGKFRGLVGALVVLDEQGRRFALGSGLSMAERRQPPPIGAVVSYRYQGRTRAGLPRFARFLRLRPVE